MPRPPLDAGPSPMPRPALDHRPDPAPRPGPRPDDPPRAQAPDDPPRAQAPDSPRPVCSTAAILGERLSPITGAGACGILRPVALASVAGVALAPAPTLGCHAAHAVAKPSFEADGAPLVALDIAAAYVCRTVNYAEDGEVSEHARGRAVDISGFCRADGSHVGVLHGWDAPDHGDLLREIHAGACGIFGTSIGPESDARHADHFHYDVAERRRPYCP